MQKGSVRRGCCRQARVAREARRGTGCKRVRCGEDVAVWVARNFRPTKKVATGAGPLRALLQINCGISAVGQDLLQQGRRVEGVVSSTDAPASVGASRVLSPVQKKTRPAVHSGTRRPLAFSLRGIVGICLSLPIPTPTPASVACSARKRPALVPNYGGWTRQW